MLIVVVIAKHLHVSHSSPKDEFVNRVELKIWYMGLVLSIEGKTINCRNSHLNFASDYSELVFVLKLCEIHTDI